MSSHRLFALVFLIEFAGLMFFTTAQLQADITYELVDYQLDQDGHTLSGTITTDGFIGVLGVPSWPTPYAYTPGYGGHITGGTFQIDNGDVYMANFIPPGSGVVEATSDGKIVLYPTTDTNWYNNCFSLNHSEPYTGSCGLEWYNSETVTTHYYGSLYSGNVWQTYNLPAGEGHIANNDPWVIAQIVPEPTTLILLCTAFLGLGGRRFLRIRTGAKK
jgi:hypothetical protein